MNSVVKCPFRDKIWVENEIFPTRSHRPVRDGMLVENIFPKSRSISCQVQHCVPNGTPDFTWASDFYRYSIPIRDYHAIINYSPKILKFSNS